MRLFDAPAYRSIAAGVNRSQHYPEERIGLAHVVGAGDVESGVPRFPLPLVVLYVRQKELLLRLPCLVAAFHESLVSRGALSLGLVPALVGFLSSVVFSLDDRTKVGFLREIRRSEYKRILVW